MDSGVLTLQEKHELLKDVRNISVNFAVLQTNVVNLTKRLEEHMGDHRFREKEEAKMRRWFWTLLVSVGTLAVASMGLAFVR